jgi:hypothetical protein
MREFFIFQWLVLSAFTKRLSMCESANGDKNAWTFFKPDTNIPGPTMSFNNSFNQGIFEFEFRTFVDRALLLYQDDGGKSEFFRLEIFLSLL